MEDFIAFENSWKLSENFEKNCKEICEVNCDGEINFSLDYNTSNDNCTTCLAR